MLKKATWGNLNNHWVPPDVREKVINEVESLGKRCGLSISLIILWIGIRSSKFYSWKRNPGKPEKKPLPRSHWLLPEEKQAIVQFKWENPQIGYRRLTWMMVDQDVCYVSPASVLRVLSQHGLNTIWTSPGGTQKSKGFIQPRRIHKHWHVDIAYVNVMGTFMFLISVLDGYSRYISVGHPQSNGKIERFHRTIKSEKTRVCAFTSPANAQKQVADYINFYNNERLHASLNYLRPKDYFSPAKRVQAAKAGRLLRGRKNKLVKAREARRLRWQESAAWKYKL